MSLFMEGKSRSNFKTWRSIFDTYTIPRPGRILNVRAISDKGILTRYGIQPVN